MPSPITQNVAVTAASALSTQAQSNAAQQRPAPAAVLQAERIQASQLQAQRATIGQAQSDRRSPQLERQAEGAFEKEAEPDSESADTPPKPSRGRIDLVA